MRSHAGFLLLSIAFAIVVVTNVAFFDTGFYARFLAPDSAAGSFDDGLRRIDRDATDPARDVLVLGDSRMFSGLDVATANAAAPSLRFLDAGIPGTTPRCWYVFDRALDPRATRFRAVVIPVDTYADDDGAIGSVDNDDHAVDLHYVAFQTSLVDDVRIAGSFPEPDARVDAFFSLLLRGPLAREDMQAFAAEPAARFAALRATPEGSVPSMRDGSLTGLRADFAHETLAVPPSFPADRIAALERQVLHRAAPSPAYARYRREWLQPIVERYRAAGVPVVFVRIPTRPLHRAAPAEPGGVLPAIARASGATLLDQTPYVALERPQFFVDEDHLSAVGARAFSTMLGRDVARVVLAPATASVSHPPISTAPEAADMEATAPRHRFPFVAASLTALAIGVPMQITSFAFFTFVAFVALVFYALHDRTLRRLLLLVASYYFYARWNAWYLAVLLGLTATDYAFGLLVQNAHGRRRGVMLWLGVGANLAFLGTAKYADFFTGTIAAIFGRSDDPWALHVLVPIGISFHTFQSISYLVDVSRGKFRAVRDPLDYALYLAFFPQLLAGPIVRANRFFSEWWRKRGVARFSMADPASGIGRIVLGLFKKIVVADRFAAVSDAYFLSPGTHPGALAAWSATLAFALQIYFDFSGYTDIAIGSARVLGFRFPPNFRRPYLAWSVGEFWRRWHMTLSYWLRDYVYIPLGGSRGSLAATVRNLLVTMLLGGLWHGANWTFVAWGAFHGIALSCERVFGSAEFARQKRSVVPIRIATTALTFVVVILGWVLFRASNFAQAARIYREMFEGGAGSSTIDVPLVLLAIALTVVEIGVETKTIRLWRAPMPLRAVALAAIALAVEAGSYTGTGAPFIYFRF